VSSKADDFDVRYRDAGATGGIEHGRSGPSGGYGVNGYGATIDYDLGYDTNGWDTNGFRSPEADYPDSHARTAVTREARSTGSTAPRTAGAHAAGTRAAGAHAAGARTAGMHPAGPQEATQSWEPESFDRDDLWSPEAPEAGRRRAAPIGPPGPGGPGGPRGSAGPAGPRRPAGPGGLRRPGHRSLPQTKVKGSWWRHWTLRKALGVLLAGLGAIVVLGAIAVAVAYEETPVPSEAMAATSFTQSVVESSNGTLIGRFGTTNRQMLTYNQIPKSVIDAVLAAEDRNFFNEGGVSPTGIVRAAYEDATGGDGSLQGGSTITQEFVRNYYAGIGTQETFGRKIKEIFVALKVGKDKSKQWILTNYLNTIYLGDGAYGVEAAAETYFGKHASQLDPAQAAVIAAIIQQPSTYPLPQFQPQLEARWHYVLNGMVQMGDLTQQQADAMKFPRPGDNVPQIFGPDVWDPYVLAMVKSELEQVYHFSQQQIDDGGYVIRTSLDDAKMAALYRAVSQNEATIDEDSSVYSFKSYMHVGAVLENPANGTIQALYPGPGFAGSKYNGTGRVITKKECGEIDCQYNLAWVAREQVGSSFKPYILATAVKQGMDVQTSTLDGYNFQYIPPDTEPKAYPTTTAPAPGAGWSGLVSNDDPGENGPYTPQRAMAESINTAYSDLWHVVAGAGNEKATNNVGAMAQAFGVDTAAAGITGHDDMQDEYGVTLGQASLTVIEQASMLATIDDSGVYHDPHLITKIMQNNVLTPIKITSYPVFNSSPTLNADEASQVQYAMSEDTAPYGTAPTAAMSNGQELIAKTGTTNDAQSAFFIGAIPTQALAVGLFTENQSGKPDQTLNNLGGNSQGGFGGTWPAAIWHTYAENEFVPLGVEPFPAPVFTGTAWNLVPSGLRVSAPKKKNHGNPTGGPSSPGNPDPFPTYSCDPSQVTCGTPQDNQQSVSATLVGGAGTVGGIFAGLPATCLWVRRRMRKRGPKRG
jgi:membrane peptidoglycan carboxypeptidase